MFIEKNGILRVSWTILMFSMTDVSHEASQLLL